MTVETILEDFVVPTKPMGRRGNLKRKVVTMIGKNVGDDFTRQDMKTIIAKASKIKRSTKKESRRICHQLVRQVDLIPSYE